MFPKTLEAYLRSDIQQFERQLSNESPEDWDSAGRQHALQLFREAARRVPAYGDFLYRLNVNANAIVTGDHLQDVPATDKENYIDQYAPEELMWDGKLPNATLFNSSSGTGGKTYWWPTSNHECAEAATIYEHHFCQTFDIANRSTLLVICFGMGTWIAGAYTYNATQHLNRKSYDFTTITPGFEKEQAKIALESFGEKYDQIVIAGIPSFVRDFVSDVQLPHGRMRFLLAGEGFTESWRDYVLGQVKGTDPSDILSLYGSADAGLMGFETPLSIATRRALVEDTLVRGKLLESDRIPMLFQYLPTHRFYELQQEELLISANRALPLVRYNLHDEGRLLSADQISDASPSTASANQLPFVAVYGRGQFGATLYGANIYAEDVQNVFLDKSLAGSLTGRFVMETNYDINQVQRLQLHVELARPRNSETAELAEQLGRTFIDKVRGASSEYRKILTEYGTQAHPQVALYELGECSRFPDRQSKTS